MSRQLKMSWGYGKKETYKREADLSLNAWGNLSYVCCTAKHVKISRFCPGYVAMNALSALQQWTTSPPATKNYRLPGSLRTRNQSSGYQYSMNEICKYERSLLTVVASAGTERMRGRCLNANLSVVQPFYKHMNKLKLTIVFTVRKTMHARLFSMATVALCRHFAWWLSWDSQQQRREQLPRYVYDLIVKPRGESLCFLTKLFLQLALIHISIIDINTQAGYNLRFFCIQSNATC